MNREKCKYKNNHKLAPDYFRKMYDRVLNTPSEITILNSFSQRFLLYRNQSMIWFLYDRDLRHEIILTEGES